jgi:hypothetical protein
LGSRGEAVRSGQDKVVAAHHGLPRRLFPLILTLLIATSFLAELRSYARPDTGFLLDAAGRVLDGSRLYVDVVEINPPLVIGLNALAVACARALGASSILVYRVGVAALLLVTLALSSRWLRRLLPEDLRLRRALLLTLAFVLFALPGPDFGEREHLVLALLLPYLLLAAARGVGERATPWQGLWPGLVAGFAFALKPHFLLVWLGVEAWLRATRRVHRGALLPETLAIAGTLGACAVSTAVLTPEYFGIVRLLAGPYSRFLYDPFWHVLVTGPGSVLALFSLLTFVALRGQARHQTLWISLALATATCLLAGAAQQKGLSYHLYPAKACATMLLGLVVLDTPITRGRGVRLVYGALAVAVFASAIVVGSVDRVVAAAGRAGDSDQRQFEDLVRLVHGRAANADVFVMSYHIRSAYPLINYSGARSASRFPHLWILASEYLNELKQDRPLKYHDVREMSQSERYLNRAVLQDLERRPKLLLVLRPARDVPLNAYRRLDYVAYFSRTPDIGTVLQEYQLVAQTGDYLVYEWAPAGARRTGAAPTAAPGTQDIVVTREVGASLKLGDPRLLIAVLTFLGSLVVTTMAGRSRVPQVPR